MDFNANASNIILIIFQMKVIFQPKKKFNRLMLVWIKNFSNVIKMVQLIHIQYMIKYFMKFCTYLHHF
jgi:hypothetical protein